MNSHLSRLPVLVISVHNRCNCRCTMCDIWKRTEAPQLFTAAELTRHLDDIRALQVEWVVFTGGEPLMNPDLFRMAEMLRAEGIRVTLLTSGLLLGRNAQKIAAQIDDVIVSLDGPPSIHDRIRGILGAFDQLASGLQALRLAAPELSVSARCTVQRANCDSLVATARTARSLGLRSISYLAVDVTSSAFNHGLGVQAHTQDALLLAGPEIGLLEAQIVSLLADPVFEMVSETPEKLFRIAEYFRSLSAGGEPSAPLCNAPWVSAVLGEDGSVSPCFFHKAIGNVRNSSLERILNAPQALAFREGLDIASNPVCRRCVCSLHRPVAISEASPACA